MITNLEYVECHEEVDAVKYKADALVVAIQNRCKGARIIPSYNGHDFDERYAINKKGQITDLQTGAELVSGHQGQVSLMVVNSKNKLHRITNQRALALAFFGFEVVGNKSVHLINNTQPLSLANLQVCNGYKDTAGAIKLNY